MTFVYIVFIGHHKARLTLSMNRWAKIFPVQKIILITGAQETSGEAIARKVAKELLSELSSPLYDVKLAYIDQSDLVPGIYQLSKIVLSEKDAGQDVLLDISGSLRIFSLIAYIVACLTQTRLVSVIPKYDGSGNELTDQVEKYLEIPTLPTTLLGEGQLQILRTIGSGTDSIDKLVKDLCPKCIEDHRKMNSERARVQYYLESLEKMNFISRRKIGKNVRVELTPLGKIYADVTGPFERSSDRKTER